MKKRNRYLVWLLLLSLIASAAVAQSSPQAPPLPLQHIVFVVDNSSSMEQNDNMGLRGVAACLMLDAVELSSDVEAGIVKFNDAVTTDGQLHPPGDIRELLQAGHLGDLGGGTNMQEALSRAIGMLSGSKAEKKRIVLITDGQPAPGEAEQKRFILNNLVPNAKQVGIEIFALGLTNSVDPQFLEQVTAPTGGRSMVSQNQARLLESAEALVGQLDNVYSIGVPKHLDPGENTFEFEIRTGTDRARVTAMLDHPNEFADGEITFRLSGQSNDARYYMVRATGDRIAAWTSFFSAPGKYTLTVSTNKPGVTSHLGMKIVAEALSNLHITLRARPAQASYPFGTPMAIDAEVTTGSGAAQAGTYNLGGVIKLPSGATLPLVFNGTTAQFAVPEIDGRHTVVVTAETPPVAHATAQLTYVAQKVPLELKSNRDQLDFSQPVGPATGPREEPFTLSVTAPAGVKRPPVNFSFTLTQPAGIVELIRQGGGILQYGTAQYSIPDDGLKLALRVKVDPRKPLKRETVQGTIEFTSPNAGTLSVPFSYTVLEPEFKVHHAREAFALWWDPFRPRVVPLGQLRTDSSDPSMFSAIVPDAIFDPVTNKKIADVVLRIGDQTPNAVSDKGKLRYNDIPLPPHDGTPLALVITPDVNSRWESLPRGGVPIPIELVSSFGVTTKIAPKFYKTSTFRVPVLGRLNYGRDWSALLLRLIAIVAIVMFLLLTWPQMRAFRPFEGSKEVMLKLAGPIRISNSPDDAAALVLPNSGSPIDEEIVGKVFEEPYGQRIESDGALQGPDRTLAGGDELTIAAPNLADEEGELQPVWVLTYLGFVSNEGGAISVSDAPKHWTLLKIVLWVAVLVMGFLALLHFVGTEKAAEWAYAFLQLDRLYI